jgi:SOS-response transcriptional repressor LexA
LFALKGGIMEIQPTYKATTMNTFVSQQLRRLMDAKEVKQADIVRGTGLHQPTVQRILTGASEHPRRDNMKRIARYFKVPIDFFYDSRYAESESDIHQLMPLFEDDRLHLLRWHQLQMWSGDIKEMSEVNAERTTVRLRGGLHAFAFELEGEAMLSPYPNSKTFAPGEQLHVDPERRDPKNGHYVIAMLADGSFVFRQYKSEDGTTYLKSFNPTFPAIYDGFKIVGTVVARSEDLV